MKKAHPRWTPQDQSQWNPKAVELLDGALVLVGMTYVEPAGERLEQFFGIVIAVDEVDGITLRLGGKRTGEIFRLPPDLRAIRPASPGEYRLRETNEVVSDPDYTATWTITMRAQ